MEVKLADPRCNVWPPRPIRGEGKRMAGKNGSTKPGPSKAYVRLLEGKISSSDYAATVKRSAKAGRVTKKKG